MSLLFSILSRLVIAFLPRSRHLLISWLQSPSAVILEPPKIKSATVYTVSPFIPMKWWDRMPCSSFSECWALSQLFHSPLSLSSRGFLCSSVQSFSRVRLFATPWIAARQASLPITNSWSPHTVHFTGVHKMGRFIEHQRGKYLHRYLGSVQRGQWELSAQRSALRGCIVYSYYQNNYKTDKILLSLLLLLRTSNAKKEFSDTMCLPWKHTS